jgi:DNA-binding response OmpR family regulator
MRRTNDDTSNFENDILVDDLEIKPSTRSVKYANKEVLLTFKEYELLLLLAKNPNRVFTREELLERVWGYDYYGDTRTIDVHIRHLREKIEQDATNPHYLKTIRGVGYKFSKG